MKVFVLMEKNGPRVYADERADSYEQSETHHMYSCSALTIILTGSHPIYFISAMLGVKKKNEEIAAEAERADAARAIAGADQLALEEIPELFWCCTELQMIHRGCSPAYRWHVPGYPSAV